MTVLASGSSANTYNAQVAFAQSADTLSDFERVRVVASGLRIKLTSQNISQSGNVRVVYSRQGLGLTVGETLGQALDRRLGLDGYEKIYPATDSDGGLLCQVNFRPVSQFE